MTKRIVEKRLSVEKNLVLGNLNGMRGDEGGMLGCDKGRG